MSDPSLESQAQEFADDLTALLRCSLPGAPDALAEYSGDRMVVHPAGDVRLLVNGGPLAKLDVHVRCRLDSKRTWLAISESSFKITADLDRTPVIRFDYVRDASACPNAHVQVHAHRGALSHLLSSAGHPNAHDMSALHIPVGGARFRPCLEDVIQFLIQECRFDHLPTWLEAVERGRARWRRLQLRASVRAIPEDAADALRALGYEVTAPSPVPEESVEALTAW